MIIVTSERTKGSNRKDQEGEAKETIWRDDEPGGGRGRGSKRRKRRRKIVARELRSPTLNLIVSTNRHNSLTRKNQRTLTAIAQLSDASVTSAVTFQYLPSWHNTCRRHKQNAFCKLFVVITWLSTDVLFNISLSALFLLISLILARIHPFPVSLGSHERREVVKKRRKKKKRTNE